MLVFVVGDEEWLQSVIVGEIEVEALVDEIVDFPSGGNVQAFYRSLHSKVFIDFDERQKDVFFHIIGLLKIHIIVELVLKDVASAPLG